MQPAAATAVTPVERPWDRRAPEREGPPSAWALLPADLAAQGCPGRPEHVFARLQRVRTWRPDSLFLSREIRAWLEANTDLSLPRIVERHPSGDGSTKLVLELADGHRIEAVHMPRPKEVDDPRVTFCISSQVGCAMGCTFCATGAMGIIRNLTAGEIVGQVLAVMRELGPHLRRAPLPGVHGDGRAAAQPATTCTGRSPSSATRRGACCRPGGSR